MTDTLFEQLGGTYTQIGDYLLPDLSLPAEKETGNIGVWALRHKRYLKQHHKAHGHISASGRKNKNVRTGLCQNKIQYAYTSACRQLC